MSHLEILVIAGVVDLRDNHVIEDLDNGMIKISPIDINKKFTKNKIIFSPINTDHTTKVLYEFEFYTSEELFSHPKLNSICKDKKFKMFFMEHDELYADMSDKCILVGYLKYPEYITIDI